MSYVKKIIRLYFDNKYPADTERKIKKWLLSDDKADEKEEALSEIWKTSLQSKNNLLTSNSLKETKVKLGINQTQARKRTLRSKVIPIAAACILIVLIGTGSVLWIERAKDKQYLTERTINGQKKEIQLPDGSIISMNAGSSLRYRKQFDGKNREVYLSGEAFFAVHKDSSHPFIVHSGNFAVRVLGTKFNICDYDRNNIASTALVSGRVQITNNKLRQTFILAPGKALVYDKHRQQESIKDGAENSTAWQSDKLCFTDASLNDISLTLERKFNVRIHNNAQKTDERYTVKFVSGESVEQILNTLHTLDSSLRWNKEKENEYSINYTGNK